MKIIENMNTDYVTITEDWIQSIAWKLVQYIIFNIDGVFAKD